MSISSSADYVIKVYTTKANAQSDSSALSITSYGVGQVSSHVDDQYYVGFRKYWYRIEFNEPVAGFYIDWDDGEDNSPEKSNSQVVMLDKPQHYGVVSHIYTQSGTFYPLIRTISLDGFWSKYFTSGNASNTFGELDDRTVAQIGTGSQDTSLLHLDDQSSPKIPLFYPTTLPPIAILKTDRKTVYSGIYNTNIEGNLARRGLPSMVYAWFSGENTTPSVHKDVPVEVTYETVGGRIRTVTLHTKYNTISAANPVAIYDVWKILDAKLKYCTEASSAADAASNMLYPGERVYLRFCHTASIQSTAVPKLQSQTQATGSLTDRVFINYASTGTTIANNATILISDTTNFNGRFTATKEFTVSNLAQGGGACEVTTSAPHGIPSGQVVTLADCGAFTGDQTISSVGDSTHFSFLTAVTGVTAGGSAKATMKNGFMINRTTSSMPSAEANTGGWGVYDHANDPVICSLSPGWPHHVFEDRGFFTTVDASESRTRASNLTIPENRANLWLDRGDFSFNVQTGDSNYATDKLSAAENRMDTYRERHAYTHDPYVDNDFVGVRGVLDDRTVGGDNRFLDDYRLLRLQVKDDRTETAYDKLSYSKIESFSDYTQANNASKNLPEEVEERNLISVTVNNGSSWTDTEANNDDVANDIMTLADSNIISADETPKNYILIAKSERKFDRLFIGLKNIDTTNLKDFNLGRCRISLQYPVKDPLTNEIKFRALQFTDYTRAPKPTTHSNAADPDFVSLAVNGPLVFEAPDDWVKCKHDTSGLVDPTDVDIPSGSGWTFDSYAILMTIGWEDDAGSSGIPHIKYIYPYDNTHSEVIKVTDSSHVSLNSILIAQSVSWNRRGKYINITDRIGRSELRKIGSEGGSIRFGGIAFGDYSTATTSGMTDYNNVKKYQQEGTPVYLDIQRPDGTYVRFFGKIVNMSEDVPTGRVSNKWAVDMATEAVAEIANDGTWLSDGLISMGGILDERPQFI